MCAKGIFKKLFLVFCSLILGTGVLVPSFSFALPWDIDMYKQPSHKPSEIARSPVKGTVPLGHKPFTLTVEEASNTLKNPTPMSVGSVWRGKRVWNSNCFACHGTGAAGDGPVGPKMSVPSLLTDFYKTSTDGKVYAIIMLGGSNMPRYGYKLSSDLIWDVINYLRFLQGVDVEGMERPVNSVERK